METWLGTALSTRAAKILEQQVRLSESPQGMATELWPAASQRPQHARAVPWCRVTGRADGLDRNCREGLGAL